MNLKKFARIAALGLIVSATAMTSFAAGPKQCSCSYCPTVDPTTLCKDGGVQTCGSWLAVTLCPAG
ncbi:MAG TPA: hypothetical protein VEL74_01480 [Thermoanaerobaculia bacterium]|nr:hypothetical protein [Thermoanaerobaculia bacterium]